MTNLGTQLSERIGVLEDDLKKTKQTYSSAFTKLILRIKKLESKVKNGKARKRARVVLSEDEEDDSSKQGRIDEDPNTYFAQDDEVVHDQDTAAERQLEDSTAGITVSTAPINISTARESYSATGRVVYGRRKRQGLEEAIRLKKQVDEEEISQIARDEEIARQLLALDEERVTTDPKITKDIDWNDPSVQKYWNLKNKPKSEAQARKNMIVYLKNQSNYKMKDFEGISYDEIRLIFEKKEIEKDTSKRLPGKEESSSLEQHHEVTTKQQKVELNDEKEDLKGYLDIVPREDVVVNVDSLSIKYPIVDWKTYTLSENFMYYKIIRGEMELKELQDLSKITRRKEIVRNKSSSRVNTNGPRNQAVVQDGRVDIQTKNAGYSGNANKNAREETNSRFNAGNAGHYARECQKPKFCDEKYFREQMLLATKDEVRSNLNNEENDCMLDTSYGEDLEELTAVVMLMAQLQPVDDNAKIVPSYDAKAVSQLEKKAFKECENKYFDDILDLEEKLSSYDRIVYKIGQSIQTIHMLGKKPNKVYDPFLKAGLGYTNPERLKKAIAAQPKMYDGDLMHSNKLGIHTTDSEETLEDAEEKFSAEQTYFSISSTSDNGSTSKDVPSESPDLLMTISELKSKLKTTDKGKHVNTKFDKSETLGQLLCVTPFNKNPAIKAKNVSNTKVTPDKSNPVTSQSIPTVVKKQQHNANVITRGMYKINQEDTKTPDSKANTNVSNSTGVGSLNSVRRPKSKDNKSKNNVLKNTKSSSSYVLKTINNVSIDSNKCETKPSNVCQTNACITSSKSVNDVYDGLNMLCISSGLDVFLNSHEKCVAHNVLTRKSTVKRALFTSPVAAKSKSLGATSVVAKSRFSVAKTQQQQIRTSVTSKINTPVTTNKYVAKPSTLPSAFVSCNAGDPTCIVDCVDSGCSKHMTGNLQLLRNFVEKFMGTVRFRNDHFATITGYGDYVLGNLTICHVHYVKGLGKNLFSVEQFCDRDLEVAF
ncbi:hypothetical protein Tco_0803013 [Tanacetum coccineum]|uniref:Retrovirus-related Pol polyprotein from transposon TNT 1-94-like beta-barrel domain-containing protein n=1 Tax=Tanacetum coccineum TaxID=301880 RepID=A0ABQ5A0E4_9ASTR